MKQWVCIDNRGKDEELVMNKVYVEIESDYADDYNINRLRSTFCIIIKNELGIVSEYYQPLRFISIDEWREIQLKKIGI
jgi:hypothetical protein